MALLVKSAVKYSVAIEAAIALTVAKAAVRCFPFRRMITMSSLRINRSASRWDPRKISQASSIVARVGDWLPWRSVCLDRALALQWILRRRGVDALLHYGVQLSDGSLNAHAWIVAEGQPLVGADLASQYVVLQIFPSTN